eukprot:scaffold14259_cov134-Skeletonema_dohrnii-CCMP3373.AAC.3
MQLITLSFLLIAVAVAQAAAASTYSATANIFSAAVAASSVALVNAKNVDNGICTGGTTYCGWFSSSDCPYPYCDTNPYPYDNPDTCQGSYDNKSGNVACADLAEYQCKKTSGCKFVPISSNQKKINAVLVAFTTISVFILLVILNVVCRRLPKKETALTQPLLDEENS